MTQRDKFVTKLIANVINLIRLSKNVSKISFLNVNVSNFLLDENINIFFLEEIVSNIFLDLNVSKFDWTKKLSILDENVVNFVSF